MPRQVPAAPWSLASVYLKAVEEDLSDRLKHLVLKVLSCSLDLHLVRQRVLRVVLIRLGAEAIVAAWTVWWFSRLHNQKYLV